MTVEVAAMIGAGVAVLATGLVLVRPRFSQARESEKILVLGPMFEAVALAIFAAEHFTAARDLAPIVPHWLPAHLFWVYFFGFALLAAALSFILWRQVQWSALLLALFFLIIVATLDLPNLPASWHDRLSWILIVRETSFAAGAMVLAGSVWLPAGRTGAVLVGAGRSIVGAVMIFYASQHFLFPHHVPGVPLEKLTPAWVPAPVILSWIIGLVLLLGGVGMFLRPAVHFASVGAGLVLLLLTAFFYIPMLIAQFHSAPIEGLNYVGDTLLFAATVLLAGNSVGPETSNTASFQPRIPVSASSTASLR